MEIVLATSNKHKVQEINDIVSSYLNSCFKENKNLETNSSIKFVLSPEGFNPIEDGKTFGENSKIKAFAAWKNSKGWSLADDSGLCIKALNGKPGIYSARYAETPQKRIERVLNEMNGIKDREAAFHCAMTLVNPDGKIVFTCEGICEGTIAESASGINGFGYDPIFIVKNTNKTMAEYTEEEKNKISHRYKALAQVLDYCRQI